MPHQIRVIKASEFLRADVQGNVDLVTSKKLLEELAAASAGHMDRNVLLDCRDASGPPSLSAEDLFELVQTLGKLGLGVLNRIAILRHPRYAFDRARFFEMVATAQGFQVGAFDGFEEAFEWLSA